MIPGGLRFAYNGFLDGGAFLFTILGCLFTRQFPSPCFEMDEDTKVMEHSPPSWDSLHRVIELCSGMGALGHGALAMGFQSVVGNDVNGKMSDMFSRMSSIPSVTGDICNTDVLFDVWKHGGGAHTVTAGFSCQPFSSLGDRRGQEDARSKSLQSVLSAAFYLQCFILILECVAPAGTNQWVQQELQHFQEVTGFVCTQVVLKLDDVWPCRRERWWCILSSPVIGCIPIDPWPVLPTIPSIDHLIPFIHLWAEGDEDKLALTHDEQIAFGVCDGSYPKYLMNTKGTAPCALHAWGSQLTACPCDCRSAGLPTHRLETKGLFGLLVRSADNAAGESTIRHVHPNEAMILNGVDPVLDYGPNVKLTLSAVGQLASPLQALWIFAAIAAKLDKLQFGHVTHSVMAHLEAYRSWLVMRSGLVWPREIELISDSNLLALIAYWKPLSKWSLGELMNLSDWQPLWDGPMSLAAILDHVIKRSAGSMTPKMPELKQAPQEPDTEEDVDMPTPWLETVRVDQTCAAIPALQCSEGQIAIFVHDETPVIFTAPAGVQVAEFLAAHNALTGRPVVGPITLNGHEVDALHVIQPGQQLIVQLPPIAHEAQSEPRECGPLPIMPVGQPDALEGAAPDGQSDVVMPTEIDPCPPTALWNPPIPELQQANADHHPVGESRSDAMFVGSPMINQSWISAAPLLALSDEQFVKLPLPHVCDVGQLCSLRSQFIQTADRIQIAAKQGFYLADDEIRFHLVQLQRMAIQHRSRHHASPRLVSMIDPLLASGWIRDDGPSCAQWAANHPDTPTGKADLMSVFQVDGHWVPVYISVVGNNLVFHTWDEPCKSHDQLNCVFQKLSQGFGFPAPVIHRQHRMFFTSNLCGALAIGFLHHVLLGTMLPSTHAETQGIHAGMNHHFHAALQESNIALRPWIWGAGDFSPQPIVSTEDAHHNSGPTSAATVGHLCQSRKARLDLIAEHGLALADDEVRFHLCEILKEQQQVPHASGDGIRFVLMEPLLYTVWDSVGLQLAESWIRTNAHLWTTKFNIISVFCVDQHWIPIWLVPNGPTLQCHLLHHDVSFDAQLRPVIDVIRSSLGFESLVLHFITPWLSDHHYCGVMAVSFLQHVVLGSPLPDSVDDLRRLHNDLRAGFVAAVYCDSTCRCPAVWGFGPSKVVSDLAFELTKRGVPADRVEQRAQHVVKQIGSEPIQRALAGKQTWRQLKMLANQVKLQLVQADELAANIANTKQQEVTKKQNMPKMPRVPQVPAEVSLDPTKLQVMPGMFMHQGLPMAQLTVQQIGPVSSGFVLMTMAEAEPYLRSGRIVSNEPLALVIFHGPDTSIQTTLPQTQVAVACRCTVNQEPILADATVIQIGKGFVEKASQVAVELESLDVITVKVLVYRDELPIDWEEFISSPIRHLVNFFPMLKRCVEPNCTCDAWHNTEGLPVQDVLLDVWRRQFLRNGFKPEKAPDADIFSVCLRIPMCLLTKVLTLSGNQGVYVEPRTPDGREVLTDFVVIWTPKLSTRELQHLRQTNPAVTGLARVGERKGLRVPAAQAQAVHAVVRPDTLYLPVGPRKTFLVGPFPYGCDRQAISRAMKKTGWEVKPLQPSTPVHGKGNVWLIQAVDDPPASVILTSHGEVIISKHRDVETVPKTALSKPVGAASTLALCGESVRHTKTDTDPWVIADPWGGYRPSGDQGVHTTPATDSLKQLETRLFDAIVEKLPGGTQMEDGASDRLHQLEGQVQQLMSKHQTLEANMVEFSQQQGSQIANLQSQITSQGQQFHGQMESQAQSIAAMFENQMQQIKGLLSKRPHEATME